MQILIKTDVTKYLEFKAVDGSFVVNNSRVEKVPITAMEAFRSPLMGLFEKRRAAKFFRCLGSVTLLPYAAPELDRTCQLPAIKHPRLLRCCAGQSMLLTADSWRAATCKIMTPAIQRRTRVRTCCG